jgi:hypothetical protein
MIRRAPAVLLCLALAACGGPAPYGPAEGSGPGFSERRIEAERWRVRYLGDARTPRETVELGALRRAAELTLAAGRDHFLVASRDVRREAVGGAALSDPFAVGFGFGGHPWGRGAFGPVRPIALPPATRWEAVAEIVAVAGPKPAGDPDAYDARAVLAEIAGPAPGR